MSCDERIPLTSLIRVPNMEVLPLDRFRHRRDAGQQLAHRLRLYCDRADVVVLALPRGGVPVGYEIAIALHVPLDVCLVRKLGVPNQPELAMGAIAPNNVCILNHPLIQHRHISPQAVRDVIQQEQAELERRQRAYRRPHHPATSLAAQTIILVDDGIATGSTFRAAIAALQHHQPQQVIAAIPVAPPLVCEQLQAVVSRVECLVMPPNLMAIGYWYENFSQTSDDEVRSLLHHAQQRLLE